MSKMLLALVLATDVMLDLEAWPRSVIVVSVQEEEGMDCLMLLCSSMSSLISSAAAMAVTADEQTTVGQSSLSRIVTYSLTVSLAEGQGSCSEWWWMDDERKDCEDDSQPTLRTTSSMPPTTTTQHATPSLATQSTIQRSQFLITKMAEQFAARSDHQWHVLQTTSIRRQLYQEPSIISWPDFFPSF